MPRTHYQTDLSVGPPLEISTDSAENLPFAFNPVSADGVDSGLTAVSAEVTLTDLATMQELDDDSLTITAPDDNASIVHIDAGALGLRRGGTYELLVVMTLDDGTTDDGTLVLSVVAG
jgi:hypothetical protein